MKKVCERIAENIMEQKPVYGYTPPAEVKKDAANIVATQLFVHVLSSSSLSSLMQDAIARLRAFQHNQQQGEEPIFKVGIYTELINKGRLNERLFTTRMIHHPDLTSIKGNTFKALVDRGWLQQVIYPQEHLITPQKTERIQHYRFVDLDQPTPTPTPTPTLALQPPSRPANRPKWEPTEPEFSPERYNITDYDTGHERAVEIYYRPYETRAYEKQLIQTVTPFHVKVWVEVDNVEPGIRYTYPVTYDDPEGIKNHPYGTHLEYANLGPFETALEALDKGFQDAIKGGYPLLGEINYSLEKWFSNLNIHPMATTVLQVLYSPNRFRTMTEEENFWLHDFADWLAFPGSQPTPEEIAYLLHLLQKTQLN